VPIFSCGAFRRCLRQRKGQDQLCEIHVRTQKSLVVLPRLLLFSPAAAPPLQQRLRVGGPGQNRRGRAPLPLYLPAPPSQANLSQNDESVRSVGAVGVPCAFRWSDFRDFVKTIRRLPQPIAVRPAPRRGPFSSTIPLCLSGNSPSGLHTRILPFRKKK
jgi:hypothetical protein